MSEQIRAKVTELMPAIRKDLEQSLTNDLDDARAERALFVGAKLAETSLRKAVLDQSLFVEADLTDADFSEADMLQCNLTGARCLRTKFTGAELTYADFSHADLTEADLSSAKLFRAVLHRALEEKAVFSNRAAALGDDADLAEAEDWPAKY